MKKYFLFFLLLLPKLGYADATERALERIVGGVQEFELENGLKVLFYRKEEAPVFAAQIWVKVGGVDEVSGHTGISHLFEHMAFKGTKTIGTKDYAKETVLLERLEKIMTRSRRNPEILKEKKKELDRINSGLEKLLLDNEYSVQYERRGGVGLNASTGKDYTNYFISLPSVAFQHWAWMESDRLLNPVFRQFYKELQVVKEERRSRTDDSPDGRMYEALLSTAYWAHPYRMPLIGWPSDLDQLTATELGKFYKTYYRPDNMLIVLVGDLQFEEVKSTVTKYFSRLEKPVGEIPQVTTLEPEQEGLREAVVHFDAEPGFVLAYHKQVFPDPDDAHFAVLHSILDSGRSSVLYKALVQDRQLASSIYTSEAPGDRFPSLFLVGGEPHQGVSNDRLKNEVEKILCGLKTKLVPQADLDAAIRKVKVSFLNSLNSAEGLATQLANSQIVYGSWKDVFELYRGAFKTTAEDLQNLAKKYFVESKSTYVHREKKL